MIQGKLTILVSKTSSGKGEYLQVTSEDQMSINVVLVAESITIDDRRSKR